MTDKKLKNNNFKKTLNVELELLEDAIKNNDSKRIKIILNIMREAKVLNIPVSII